MLPVGFWDFVLIILVKICSTFSVLHQITMKALFLPNFLRLILTKKGLFFEKKGFFAKLWPKIRVFWRALDPSKLEKF